MQSARPDGLLPAIGAILLCAAALSFGDALVKLFSADFALWQIFVLRSALALPVFLALMLRAGASAMPQAAGPVVLRSAMLVAMWVVYYLALPHLTLAVAAAGYYTLPIFITLFSAAFAGERVGALGWGAVLVGFGGVLLILRPDAASFNVYALLPLLAAMLYAGAVVLTRSRCRGEHPLTLAFALNLGFIATGLLATLLSAQFGGAAVASRLTAAWGPMTDAGWWAMALMAAMMLIGSIGAAFAYQSAPASVIGVFDFTYVGFAVLWGLVIFTEFPGGLSLVGMGLIVLAGVMSLRR